MRNGEIELGVDRDGDTIDIVFSGHGQYSSHTVTWAEARILAQMLLDAADKAKSEKLNSDLFDVYHSCNKKEQEAIDFDAVNEKCHAPSYECLTQTEPEE